MKLLKGVLWGLVAVGGVVAAIVLGALVAYVFEATGHGTEEISAFCIITILNAVLVLVNHAVYALIGREEFVRREENPIFRWAVRHLGDTAFILSALLTPVFITALAQMWNCIFMRGLVYGAAITTLIICLDNDLRVLINLMREKHDSR